MNCSGNVGCDCGCCAGISVLTPQAKKNRAGLPAISYRAGRWATFKESMLARLSSSDYPALTALKTREDDDFTIAFVDATSVVLDILTFYQERLANESYLRTAGQHRSLTELSRLIGYEPTPGVSATTYVSFSLKSAPGQAPDPAASAITIPQGTQMQSVPAQGQKPQTFETSADIPAKSEWNALRVRTGTPWMPGSAGVYLSGTSTQLQLGDSLLILGAEREQGSSEQWDVAVLNRVEVDKVRNLTYVGWHRTLPHITSPPGKWSTAKVFAFRKKVALFGNVAPNPNLFVDLLAELEDPTKPATSLPNLIDASDGSNFVWKNFYIPSSSQIYLDATYKQIVVHSWFALVDPNGSQLYKVVAATVESLANYGLSAKVTELSADLTDPAIGKKFPLQSSDVWAQSEELIVPKQPLLYPAYGNSIDLDDLRPDLSNATMIAITGKRQKLAVNATPYVTAGSVKFAPDEDPSDAITLKAGDLVTLTGAASLPAATSDNWIDTSFLVTLSVEDTSGRPGTVQAHLADFSLAPSTSNDHQISEFALVSSVGASGDSPIYTILNLQYPLRNCYDRQTTTVNANVAKATHGQSVSEIMGSGSASTPDQNFALKQSPLTYVQAATPTGRLSTLEVQVNAVKWAEVSSLYQQGPSRPVFTTLSQTNGSADVIFGDGVEGARLPTGQNNLQANYRIGSGSAGNVGAGALTTLMDRPLGVSSVTNSEAATGGQDAQSIDDIRSNAPQTVLTLGRAVSITDYQSYAAIFAGIAKAYAIWIPAGPGRGVFLTVAGVNGIPLSQGDPTLDYLATSLRNYGNPLVAITVVSFLETIFGLSADVLYDPAYDQPVVAAQVQQTLLQTYSFANRTFGQGVAGDEVSSVIQGVPGVIAVNVKSLTPGQTSRAGDLASQGGAYTIAKRNNWLQQQLTSPLPRPSSGSPASICPYLPMASLTAFPQPAEILVLDPDPKNVVLGVMS